MSRPTGEQLAELVDEALKLLDRVRKHGPTVLARANAGGLADGYPTRSMADGGGGGDGTSRPERLALSLWSNQLAKDGHRGETGDPYARHQKDPVRYNANAMAHELNTALRSLRAADAAIRHVLEVAAPPEQAPVGSRERLTPPCIACDRDALPRPVRGMCHPCYQAWQWQGHPEMSRFREQRLRKVAEDEARARKMAA